MDGLFVTSALTCLFRRFSLDRQRMDAALERITQRFMNHAMPFDPRFSPETGSHNMHHKMPAAALTYASVPRVFP